jgi:hypothetical protein
MIVRALTTALVGECLFRNSMVYTNPKLAVALPIILIYTPKLNKAGFSEAHHDVIAQKTTHYVNQACSTFGYLARASSAKIWSPRGQHEIKYTE